MRILVAILALLSATAASAGDVFDMRKCPLDTRVFPDPWSGGTFTVKRVGSNQAYLCDGEFKKRPVDGQYCAGPYGQLALVGDLTKSDGEKIEPVVAIWEVAKAAPCCGWRVIEDGSDDAKRIFATLEWLTPDNMPTLGEMPFASIERPEYISVGDFSSAFGNPKMAMICTLR